MTSVAFMIHTFEFIGTFLSKCFVQLMTNNYAKKCISMCDYKIVCVTFLLQVPVCCCLRTSEIEL